MKRKWILSALLATLASVSSCTLIGVGDDQGIAVIEAMSEAQYTKWQLYLKLGVKIGANQLLESGTVTLDELDLAATALETVRDQTATSGVESILTSALEDVGLNNDEIALLLLIVEQEIRAGKGFEWLDLDTGLVGLSPRTKDLLTVVADALRSATLVTANEATMYRSMNAE